MEINAATRWLYETGSDALMSVRAKLKLYRDRVRESEEENDDRDA